MDAQKIKVKAEEIKRRARLIEYEEGMTWAVAAGYALRIRQDADEILSLVGEDEPVEEVRVFDNGGTSFDRYTVFIGPDVYTMSSHPLSPQGMNQWAGRLDEQPWATTTWGAELGANQIPPEVNEAIEQRRHSSRFNKDQAVASACKGWS